MADGSVYFATDIHDSGAIKIGFTAGNPETRLAGIQTGSPYKLKILCSMEGDMELERRLHVKLSPYRLSGEWFARCKTVIDTAEAAAKGHLNPTTLEPLHGTQGDIVEALERALETARAGGIEGLLVFMTGPAGSGFTLDLSSSYIGHHHMLQFMMAEAQSAMNKHVGWTHFRNCEGLDLRDEPE